MKKFLLLLAAVTMTATASFAQSYRGFVDLSYDIATPATSDNITYDRFREQTTFGLSTSHGVQLKKWFIGLGFELCFSKFGFQEPLVHSVPVFAHARYDFFRAKKTNFFVDAKLGYIISAESLEMYVDNGAGGVYPGGDYTGLYFKPSVGVRFRLSQKVGINLALTYQPVKLHCDGTERNYIGGEEEYEYITVNKNLFKNRFGLSVGIDF